jgi:hypothetical protein
MGRGELHHTRVLELEAPPEDVWRSLFWRPKPGTPQVIEHGSVRIELLHRGDEAGLGLVRTCTYRVPKWLLTGGVGRSWECIVEAKLYEVCRYTAIGKPLWSRAEGCHRFEPLEGDRTRLTFTEVYYAYNGLFRNTIAPAVHRYISRDNDRLIAAALGRFSPQLLGSSTSTRASAAP